MSSGWSIRRAVPAYIESILVVEQGCAEAPHWSRDIWQRVLAEDQPSAPVRAGFVAEDGEGIAGFAVFSVAGDVAELESVAVRSSARRCGVGRGLCGEGMAWSRSQGAGAVELEVRASSAGALALYRSLGFAEQGRRKGYYHDPMEDAVLMVAFL
jgi:[ribosomal protein S18]-alanine N-acetyltransferase